METGDFKMETWVKILGVYVTILLCVYVKFARDDFLFPKTIEGEVINVEYVSGPWEHTKIIFKTFSESSVERSFEGKLDFDIGGTYRIHSHTLYFHWYESVLMVVEIQ